MTEEPPFKNIGNNGGIENMSINGIGAAGYSVTGYQTRKAEKSVESGTVGFMETIAEKAAQDKTIDYEEKAFASVGANAPEEVKQAWMDAATEIGVNGLGMSGNGMLTHISQMMVQRGNKWMNGIGDTNDILGSTVQSAIRATEQALYDFDHPLEPNKVRSVEEQQARIKERQFYVAFLEKLEKL